MKLNEATKEELQILELWEQWLVDLTKLEKEGGNLDRETELMQAFFEAHEQPIPTKGSPMALMFTSFVGGVKLAQQNSLKYKVRTMKSSMAANMNK